MWGQYKVITQIYKKECISFMRMADYPFKQNECCCLEALFLWQLQHFINMGCFSNTVAMATFMRFLLKISAILIDKTCHYALHMNEHCLNDSKKL